MLIRGFKLLKGYDKRYEDNLLENQYIRIDLMRIGNRRLRIHITLRHERGPSHMCKVILMTQDMENYRMSCVRIINLFDTYTEVNNHVNEDVFRVLNDLMTYIEHVEHDEVVVI